MNVLYRVLVVFLVVVGLSACNSKEKENLSRTKDGTETFVFKPEQKSVPVAKPGVATASKPAAARDGTETFQFKPDPKYSPKNKNGGS